jgi:hypothetical protein
MIRRGCFNWHNAHIKPAAKVNAAIETNALPLLGFNVLFDGD